MEDGSPVGMRVRFKEEVIVGAVVGFSIGEVDRSQVGVSARLADRFSEG